MITRRFLFRNRESHKSRLSSLLFHQPNLLKTPFSTLPSLHTLPRHSPNDALYKLNHNDWLSPNDVLNIFNTLKDPNSVLSVWNQYTYRKDYKPNEAIYTLVITKLAQAKNFDAIEDIMQGIKLDKSPCRLSNEFFYNVIKIYGHLGGRIKKAIEILLDMPKGYKCWPNVKTFNLVLNLLVSMKFYDVVDEVYVKAPMLGVEVDAACLNILIKGLCENGDLKAAFYVLDEFPKQRCKPNVRTFSTLMHGLCGKGKVCEAIGLIERMEMEGIEADTITFNILISGLRKQGRVEEAMEMMDSMKFKGCEPNPGSYQGVLYGLLDAGKFIEAKEFLGKMVCEGIGASFVSYKKLISGLCERGLIADVDSVLKQMVKQGFVPKMGMWKQIVGSVCSGNNATNGEARFCSEDGNVEADCRQCLFRE